MFTNKVILISGGTGSFGKEMLKFLIKILTFTSFFNNASAFVQTVPLPLPLTYTKYSTISRNNNNVMVINQECPEYLSMYKNILNQQQNEYVIKQISSAFPHMDSISHYVLHTNDVLINYVLNNSHINTEIKKMLVLFLIEFTQFGDASGGVILQLYHDLVNCLL